MNTEDKKKLLQALTVACEICGTELSPVAIKVMIKQLDQYEFSQVHNAIERCMNEITGRLTLQKIRERIDDGRPSPEIAWSQCPMHESESAVLTKEQNLAFCSVASMIDRGKTIQARMAFLEKYKSLVVEARSKSEPIKWEFQRGFDAQGRKDAISNAVTAGLIPKAKAIFMLGQQHTDFVLALEAPEEPAQLIEDKSQCVDVSETANKLRIN